MTIENQSYYYRELQGTSPGDGNLCDLTVPLKVNCAGYASLSHAFWSNGRRHDYYLQLMDVGEMLRQPPGQQEQRFTAGEFILHPPETPYCYGLAKDLEMGYYWVHFTGGFVENLLKSTGLETGRAYRADGESMTFLRRTFRVIFHELAVQGQGCRELCAARLAEMLVRLGRLASGEAALREARFANLLEYIHSHYTEELRIADLAESEHLSVSRFRDVFHETFGCAPSEYIMDLRLRHARDLLSGTDLSVTEIARLCGFNDKLYFMRLFRKKTGRTARAYRMEHAFFSDADRNRTR